MTARRAIEILTYCHGASHQSRNMLGILGQVRLGQNRTVIGEISGPGRADYA